MLEGEKGQILSRREAPQEARHLSRCTNTNTQIRLHKYKYTNAFAQALCHKDTWRYLHDISWYLHNKNKRQEMLMMKITMFFVDDKGGDIYVTGFNA